MVADLRDSRHHRTVRNEQQQACLRDSSRSPEDGSVGRLAGGIAHDFNTFLAGHAWLTPISCRGPRSESELQGFATQYCVAAANGPRNWSSNFWLQPPREAALIDRISPKLTSAVTGMLRRQIPANLSP